MAELTKKAVTEAADAEAPLAVRRTGPVEFFQQVNKERKKVTWPSWKETWITSIMVFMMVLVTAFFFLLVDGSFSFLLQQVLKLAG